MPPEYTREEKKLAHRCDYLKDTVLLAQPNVALRYVNLPRPFMVSPR